MLDQAAQEDFDSEPFASSSVVVGHGSSKENGLELAHFVTQRRYFVDTFDASADDADERIQDWVDNSLDEPKMFFLVVSQKDVDEGNRPWVQSKVLDQARKLLSAFGKGRVILVVEAGIIDFDYNSGLDDILFPPGKLSSTYRSVAAFLVREFGSEGNAGPGSGKPTSKKRSEREPLETDVKMAIALLALAAIFGGIYMIRLFTGNSSDEAVPEVGGVELSLPSSQPELAGPEQTQPPTTVLTPPAQATALPATCRISLVRSTTLPGIVYCDDGGALRVTGYSGPWHNSVARIGLETQVTGSFVYEQNGNTVSVGPGVSNLDPSSSRFGVQEMVFQFEADGKRVQFEQFPEDGQRVVTFTFDASLQRP